MLETGQSVPISGTQQKLEMIEKEIDRLHEQKKKIEAEIRHNYFKFYETFKRLKKEKG